jgi:hypothetical protein
LELEVKDRMDFFHGSLLYLLVDQEEEQLVSMPVEEMEEKELMVVAGEVEDLALVHQVARVVQVEMV